MQTVYFTTTHFIRHQGNVVDLAEYRRKLAEVQGQSEPEQPQVCLDQGPAAEQTKKRRPLLALDYVASGLLILTALLFVLKLL